MLRTPLENPVKRTPARRVPPALTLHSTPGPRLEIPLPKEEAQAVYNAFEPPMGQG